MVVSVEVDGLGEFRRALRTVDRDLSREMVAGLREVAKIVSEDARRRASSGTARGGGRGLSAAAGRRGTAQQARYAKAIRPAASARGARLDIVATSKRQAGALGAFWGSHSPRFPPWVGNRWDPDRGTGPYVIVDAIRETRDEVIAATGDRFDDLAARAFPD